ncbi:MAG: hypothetical protein R8G01_07015 [Ilumatobacteraceae bacterium]|nr:hypothetical protein [Ilumatobacteraceae bacterium]
MRSVSVVAAVAGFALTACGATEPTGEGLPAPSSSDTVDSVVPSSTDVPGLGRPSDAAARTRPDLMTVTPAVAAPGAAIELTFPEETARGVAYVLEVAAGDTWSTTHYLTSSTDGYGGEPSAVSVDAAEGYGWDDIGIGGPGPDRLVLPDDAFAGASRICTENALDNFCAEITVDAETAVAAPPDTTTPDSLPVDSTLAPEVTPSTMAAAPVPIVAVHEDVAFYPACGNETLTFEGVTWYQLNQFDGYDDEYAEIYETFADADREASPVAGWRGFAPAVVEPGPGDDTGTLVIWADGVGRWVSDSGDLDTWMVDDEITYDWDC